METTWKWRRFPCKKLGEMYSFLAVYSSDKEMELVELELLEQSPSSQESQEESPQQSPSPLIVKQEDNKEKEQKMIIGFGFDDDDDHHHHDLPDLSKLTELFELIPDNDLT